MTLQLLKFPFWAMPTQGEGGTNPMFIIILFGALIAIWYFVVIRPQKQQQEEHEVMVSSLKKGDDIVTVGGVHGTVTDLKQDKLTVQIASDVEVTIDRSSVASVQGDDDDPDES